MAVQHNGLTHKRFRTSGLAVFAASAFVVSACGTAAPPSGGAAAPTTAVAPPTAAAPTTAPAAVPTAAKVAPTAAPAPTLASAAAAKPGAAPAWCGPKQITLSVSDGFGGNNWRRITSGE